jgi:hypothetical protein
MPVENKSIRQYCYDEKLSLTRHFLMNKRQFLGAAAVAGALPVAGQAAQPSGRGPALLTVTGAIAHGNRGPLDPALDQMMHKHQVTFTTAWAFDYASLLALPPVTIRPTLEYDGKPHTLRGPLLTDVLARAGATVNDRTILILRAVDGYNVELPVAQARARRFIVATHIDGKSGTAMGRVRRGPGGGDGGIAAAAALCRLPVGAVSRSSRHVDVKADQA